MNIHTLVLNPVCESVACFLRGIQVLRDLSDYLESKDYQYGLQNVKENLKYVKLYRVSMEIVDQQG